MYEIDLDAPLNNAYHVGVAFLGVEMICPKKC
nr:MAG TPA: hypothetical protein [Caudoviricetes sp.]